jgi:DNA repair exonuclease SbcCD ATPase subunit
MGIDSPSSATLGAQSGQLLDDGLRRLATLRRERERRLDVCEQLVVDLGVQSPIEPPNLPALRQAVDERQQHVSQAQTVLDAAESAAAEARKRQVELRDAAAELRSLAQLALRHLDERCPVCEQEYDQEATRSRLERLAEAADGLDDIAPTGTVVEAAESLREAERQLSIAAQEAREAEAVVREAALRSQDLRKRLTELGIAEDPGVSAMQLLSAQSQDLRGSIERHDQLQQRGEQLAVLVARLGEAARRGEVEREIAVLHADVARLEADVEARERTGQLVVQLVEGLRKASSDVVKVELERIDPLLQRIFSTIDPHPAFRAVRLLTQFAYRRGRVSTQLEDRMFNRTTDSPAVVLSSSQLNGLAVSVFLALNLGMRALPLQTLIIDDPLQSLDDVNLLGLVDLLRRAREYRQVIISTHDPRFGDLLARKLRPVRAGQRTLLYRFQAWSREGPLVEMEEVPADAAILRIAHSAA